ncbi:RDD family protein [Pontibacter harenae]|uniref:RDD family protein n=1 Tax=Pontibacter harenae TaxID=2894083 RepID=UPI001E402F18|nr:RDD family protein [Pontibacter harenae]MCC9166906.1 RDD family protein [Pontibacter harenae]
MLTTVSAHVFQKTSHYGSLNSRLISLLVDTTIIVFCYSIIFYSATEEDAKLLNWKQMVQNGFTWQEILFVGKALFYNPYFLIMHWLYYTLLEASPRQATIGKFTLGLRVCDVKRRRIKFAQANARYFAKVLSLATLGLGFLLVHSTKRNQALHDYLSGTLVVSE